MMKNLVAKMWSVSPTLQLNSARQSVFMRRQSLHFYARFFCGKNRGGSSTRRTQNTSRFSAISAIKTLNKRSRTKLSAALSLLHGSLRYFLTSWSAPEALKNTSMSTHG